MKALLQSIAWGLSLWNSKEKRKYIDKIVKIKKEYYEEYNEDRPDMAKLDTFKRELYIIWEAIQNEAGITDIENL